jgi:tetraacyldisaccharide 4'-kinase
VLRAPAFWQHDGLLPKLLSPLSLIGATLTARRLSRDGWHAPVPVICCGNATVGGAGKTTLALDLAHRLSAAGRAVHVLLRGYGGSEPGAHRVTADDPVPLVGDEALLLAQVAPTWTGSDRSLSARAAIAAGAAVLLMDDGLQNPTLAKDLSLLVIDGGTGFGNGRVLPAGPLREPVSACASRCQAAVLIGPDTAGALAVLPPDLAVLRARLVQDGAIDALRGRRVLTFAGIAVPEKFFAPLAASGAEIIERVPFPDHHLFTRRELDKLLARAAALDAIPVTTPKDFVRLPADMRSQFREIGVRLCWEDPSRIEALLASIT